MLGGRISACPVIRYIFDHIEISSEDIVGIVRYTCF